MLPAIIGIHRKAPCLIARLPVRSFVLTRQPFIPPLPKTKPSFIKTRSFGATLDARQKEMDLESSSQGAAKLDLKYNESANKLLGDICDYLEKTAVPGLSNVELQDGVLSIEFDEDKNERATNLTKTILINKHYINRQLWYSSPLSGGDYFSYQNGWQSIRSNKTLVKKLEEELSALSSTRVPLSEALGWLK